MAQFTTIISWNLLHRYHEERYVGDKSRVLQRYPNENIRNQDIINTLKKVIANISHDKTIFCFQELNGDLLNIMKTEFSDQFNFIEFKYDRVPTRILKPTIKYDIDKFSDRDIKKLQRPTLSEKININNQRLLISLTNELPEDAIKQMLRDKKSIAYKKKYKTHILSDEQLKELNEEVMRDLPKKKEELLRDKKRYIYTRKIIGPIGPGYEHPEEYLVVMLNRSFWNYTHESIPFTTSGKGLQAVVINNKLLIVNTHLPISFFNVYTGKYSVGRDDFTNEIVKHFVYQKYPNLRTVIVGDYNRTMMEAFQELYDTHQLDKLSCFVDNEKSIPLTFSGTWRNKYQYWDEKSIDNIIGFNKVHFTNFSVVDVDFASDHNLVLADIQFGVGPRHAYENECNKTYSAYESRIKPIHTVLKDVGKGFQYGGKINYKKKYLKYKKKYLVLKNK